MPIEFSAPPVQNPPIRPSAPSPGAPVPVGRFVLDLVRIGWRWLTRMRTALWMLLWLGVLAAAATVIPQNPNVPSIVERWLSDEEGLGAGISEVLWRTGAFDVYGSAIRPDGQQHIIEATVWSVTENADVAGDAVD